MYEIFGKYGAIRQIRLGDTSETRGNAYVVYEDIFDAQVAIKHTHGYSLEGRFLRVSYYKPPKKKVTAQDTKLESEKLKQELEELRRRHGVGN